MTLVELIGAARCHRDRCLIALYHAAESECIDSLRTHEIAEKLRNARVPKAARINVSDVLGTAGDLVDCVPDPQRRRRWTLTMTGSRYIQDLLRKHFGELTPSGGTVVEAGKGTAQVRLLFLAVAPRDAQPLRLDQEYREIQERIRAAKHRDSIQFSSGWAVRPDDLFQLLHESGPTIVHFSGHGSNLNRLAFEDQTGSTKPVTGEALAVFFKAMHDSIRLVVLNACHSATAGQQIAEHIDCVIGMTRAIDDRSAIQFAAAFYRSIGFGKSVQRAFREARASLVIEGLPDDDVPVLIARKGVDPEQVVLADELVAT